MSVEIKVPALPESVADAVIAGWHKQAGDAVTQDETLVELETDKVILEVPAISSGVIKEILFNVGDTVTADQVLAVIDDTAEAPSAGPSDDRVPEPVQAEETPSPPATPAQDQGDEAVSSDVAISPAARKLMLENNIRATDVTVSGKGGRILKEDVLAYLKLKQQPEASEKRAAAPAASQAGSSHKPQFDTGNLEGRIEKRVPMTRLRARIAERLLEAQQNAAILTTFNEVNMKPVMDLRATYKDSFEKEYGVKLGFMSFFVKASVEALKKFPAVNASIDGNDIVYHGYYDIGIAVSGPSGLVVPILRNVEDMTLAQIEKGILAYATAAGDNTLSIEDITGGTFTISNGGVFGSMLSTPILNPPQSGILGMHTIKERPMVVNGEITVLPMMYLALSYDHRIIDGREAVQFLVTIKNMLEEPSRMLIGV
ncbi:MAG: 2-oxoglutarate dehydrogenase complex dihydrolipoyllysine-residue succinyltransferase [Thiotrichales bacterium]|nr:MAG: 2-oxoglutarate dehydrogenase complex dihydrolipoyllysine-residue succinyltransferase [Thiotrichales bacterium]